MQGPESLLTGQQSFNSVEISRLLRNVKDNYRGHNSRSLDTSEPE
jgi:hypothetical protein